MEDVLGRKESKLTSFVARKSSLTNPKQASNFQTQTRHPDAHSHTPAEVPHLGERAFKPEWTNQQMTLQIPQLGHSECLQNICVQTSDKPAFCTPPRLSYSPAHAQITSRPKIPSSDHTLSLLTCTSPSMLTLMGRVRQRGFNIPYTGSQLSPSTFKHPKN